MSIKDLVPWKRESSVPARRGSTGIDDFHQEVNRMFDEFFDGFGFGLSPFGALGEPERGFAPAVSVEQTDDELVVRADLPGMDEKDVHVELQDGALVLSGERSEEKEGGRGQTSWSERRYGSFKRVVALPHGIDGDSAKASFKKGVLTVKMPHKALPANARTITVETG